MKVKYKPYEIVDLLWMVLIKIWHHEAKQIDDYKLDWWHVKIEILFVNLPS